MEQKTTPRPTVKDRLLAALIGFAGKKDWSEVTVTELIGRAGVARASFYRNFRSVAEVIDYGIRQITRLYSQGRGDLAEDLRSKPLMEYKFRFYREYAELILAFHRAQADISLLDVITDCEIEACGGMPASSIRRYELYYYSGAFYNMMLCWLEGGARESPEAMADAFLALASGKTPPPEIAS